MQRTLYVLSVIGITICLIQIAYCTVQWINDPEVMGFIGGDKDDTLIRILTYFTGGVLVAAIGIAVQLMAKQRLLGAACYVGGFYLMLLGANGGFWSDYYYPLRALLSAGIIAFLCLGIVKLERDMNRLRAAADQPSTN